MRFTTALTLLVPAVVTAAPTNSSANSPEDCCDANDDVLLALQRDAAATSYCLSYLSIPTLTYTSTATETPASLNATLPVTVTGDAVTSTTTFASTTTTDITTTETSTEIATETSTSTTATTTFTCLNSAYTASAPVGTILKRGRQAPRSPCKGHSSYSKPTCIPTTWDSAAISSVCSCLSIPTPSTAETATQTLAAGTITVTSTDVLTPTVPATDTTTYTATSTHTETSTTTTTTTLTAYAEATTIASNGVTYKRYTHNFNADAMNNGFTSTAFKNGSTARFERSGTLESLTFSTDNWPNDSGDASKYLNLAGQDRFNATQSAVVMQGFFVAQDTGTYTLSSSRDYIDNWGYLWTGDVAYSQWNDSNTAFMASRTEAGYYGGEAILNLNEGDAVPITWLWANGGGVSQSYFEITSPDGTSTTDTTGYFVQACNPSSVFP